MERDFIFGKNLGGRELVKRKCKGGTIWDGGGGICCNGGFFFLFSRRGFWFVLLRLFVRLWRCGAACINSTGFVSVVVVLAVMREGMFREVCGVWWRL